MTSLAFVLGVLPLAISSGAGAKSRVAIGTAVIGGTLTTRLLTVLFVPFSIFSFAVLCAGDRSSFDADPTMSRPMIGIAARPLTDTGDR